MEKTITFTMTESQAKKFEELLDAGLEIFRRWEKESPERDARLDREHEETMKKLAALRQDYEQTLPLLAKWKAEMENNNVGKNI
jgi:DNA-binding transcriptional regulator GbsR (MarR family)